MPPPLPSSATTTNPEATAQPARLPARRARIVGIVLTVIGFSLGTALLPFIPISLFLMSIDPTPPAAPVGLIRLPMVVLLVLLTPIVIFGFTLGIGGLGFILFKNWGRKTIRAAVWILIAYCVCFLILEVVPLLSMIGLHVATPVIIDASLWDLIITVSFAFLLWVAQRYFGSPKIKTLCSSQLSSKPMPGQSPI